MITLGIETSCDDTAVAIVDRGKILAEEIFAQTAEHAPFGGVVPEIASRAHLNKIDALIERALSSAGLSVDDIELFAAGAGPGLIGGVIVGLAVAKSLAFALDKPFVAVNHLEAHALVPAMFAPLRAPYLLLLASGGHTQILRVEDVGRYKLLGATLDDACGECFDKVAKMLGFPYMGGREVERLTAAGDPAKYDFPRPLAHEKNLDFSFSGLKTAVRLQMEKGGRPEDIAASFQAAVVEVISLKLARAVKENPDATALVASGGVAANAAIRTALASLHSNAVFPPPKYCTDNGVMIAYAGEAAYARGRRTPLDIAPRPRWPLEELNA